MRRPVGPTSSLPLPLATHLADRFGAGDIGKTGDAADPRPNLRAPVDAEEESDQGPGCGDDEGVVEQRLGNGGHALRGLGKRQQVVVAGEPVSPLVGGIPEFPRARGAQGKAGGQRAGGDEALGDGLQQLVREPLQRPAEVGWRRRCRGP